MIFQLYSDGTVVQFSNLDSLLGTKRHGQLWISSVPSLPQGLTNRFSDDLPDLAFHLSIIKLCTMKALARPLKALAKGIGQRVLSAHAYPDTGTGKSKDILNLLAIRGPTCHEGIPGIKSGSPDRA